MNIIVGNKIDEMNRFIYGVFMPRVYFHLLPTVEQQNDEEWWSDTFIHTAVNSEVFDFADEWFQRDDQPLYNDTTWDAFWVVELINKIDKWYDDIYGEKWAYESPLTLEAILKMYAYLFVVGKGAYHWEEEKDRFNEYVVAQQEVEDMSVVSDDSDEDEEPKEVYNGSKDFPPNETDETCPICLEAYNRDSGKLKDGIRNSGYESNCPHWCCCMCWDEMYKQNKDEYNCPICKRDITEWIDETYGEDDDEEPEPTKITTLIIEEDE
jgi:hypothetical protein